MNIVTRLAILEHLLEDAASERPDEVDTLSYPKAVPEDRRLVDELDQAQMLKAATYLGPSR